MFADLPLASKIERSESRLSRAGAEASAARSGGAYSVPVGRGVAAFVRVGSPMNKVVGVGLAEALDEGALDEAEALFRARGEPVRVELSTLAEADVGRVLTERGYRLQGFENVLGRPLAALPEQRASDLRVERIGAADLGAWSDVLVDGFCAPDGSGVAVEPYPREAMLAVVEDMLLVSGYDRYWARASAQPGRAAEPQDPPIASASLWIDGPVALLAGAATLPQHRRRGAQAALLAARLDDARARGAELAIVTTAPGTRSQANSMRQGFSLLYARAVLIKTWG